MNDHITTPLFIMILANFISLIYHIRRVKKPMPLLPEVLQMSPLTLCTCDIYGLPIVICPKTLTRVP